MLDGATFDHEDCKSPAPAAASSSGMVASTELSAPPIPWLKMEREDVPELERHDLAGYSAGYQVAPAASNLWALCSVLNHLAGRAQLRRWTLEDAVCATAVMAGPKDQGRHGLLYKLSDGTGPALALKLFKACPPLADYGFGGEGGSDRLVVSPSLQAAPPSLLELFHLLRCRGIEQVTDRITDVELQAAMNIRA